MAKIYAAKGRPTDNPLIVHCHSETQARELVGTGRSRVQKLTDAFWSRPPHRRLVPKTPLSPPRLPGGWTRWRCASPTTPIALDLIATAAARRRSQCQPVRHITVPPGRSTCGGSGGENSRHHRRRSHGLGEWNPPLLDCTRLPFRLLRPGESPWKICAGWRRWKQRTAECTPRGAAFSRRQIQALFAFRPGNSGNGEKSCRKHPAPGILPWPKRQKKWPSWPVMNRGTIIPGSFFSPWAAN